MSDWIPSSVSNNAFEFLLTDVDTALTFMDVADSARDKAIRQRNYKNARHAYDTVMRFMRNLPLDETQLNRLQKGLAILKSRLQNAGQQF